MNALHPLGQLIQSVEDSKGWTIREMSRRASAAGFDVSHQYLARLKRAALKSVSRDLIETLAAGLDPPERVVGLAALESMGVHDVDPNEAGTAATIARDPALTERDRRILLAIVREMQRGQDEQDGSEQRAPAAGGRSVADPAGRDGVTPAEAGERGLPWERGDFDLAADTGRSRRERMDAVARRRGEESQDPGTDEPA